MQVETRINKLIVAALSPTSAENERDMAWANIKKHMGEYGPHDLAMMVKGEADNFDGLFDALRQLDRAQKELAKLLDSYHLLEMQVIFYEENLPTEVKAAWRKRVEKLGATVPEIDASAVKQRAAAKAKTVAPNPQAESVADSQGVGAETPAAKTHAKRHAPFDYHVLTITCLKALQEFGPMTHQDLARRFGGGRNIWTRVIGNLLESYPGSIQHAKRVPGSTITPAGIELLADLEGGKEAFKKKAVL